MDIWYWRYRLVPRRALNAVSSGAVREGALIRTGSGFADVHPWTELGDAPLDDQLQLLSTGMAATPLLEASLAMAALDGDARERGVSLFGGLTIPESHWSSAAGDPPREFRFVKVKCGPATTARSLEPYEELRLRLDFNATLDVAQFLELADTLRGFDIDFVEDPVPYHAADWRRIREATGLRLALDRGVADEGVDFIVHKPAISSTLPQGRRTIVTSYMDHPVGQFGAAYVAAAHSASIEPVAGLFTHAVYEMDPFIEAIRAVGARLRAPEGTGVGFDALLEKLPWKRLR